MFLLSIHLIKRPQFIQKKTKEWEVMDIKIII